MFKKKNPLARSGVCSRGGILYVHLYKTNAPTAWTDIKGDLKPRSFNFDKIKTKDLSDKNEIYTTLMYNSECRVSISRRTSEMPYYFRNSEGDETILQKK